MNTIALAAGVVGFLLGGLTVSIAATLAEEEASHSGGTSISSTPTQGARS